VDTGVPYTVDGTQGPWRVIVMSKQGGGYQVVAVSLGYIQSVDGQLLVIDLTVSALVLVLIAFAAATVVRIGLRPLTRMEEAAAAIAAGDLSRRVADADPHTESGRLGMALNGMLIQIESALDVRTASERRMRQFLADASHELRTPLTSIQGFAELYRRGGAPPGPELDEAMGRIEAEVGRMRLLVTDLLLLARMDEERPLRRHPVDLLEVTAEAVRDAHVRVPTRFVLLDGFGPLEPVTVPADEQRIRQVVTNLIANALQHTPDDAQVVVRVGREPEGGPPPVVAMGPDRLPGQHFAAVEVADTGRGMSADQASRVFERLYRADPSRARANGGAGLGLAIVAAIVGAHGGRVELWTAPGRGARFRVLLPLERGQLRADSEAT
jgi:two-component system OmpR family sensor kinase